MYLFFLLKNWDVTTDTEITLVLIYVDDILITCSSSSSITDLITILSSKFAMKDLGCLSYFLDLEVLYHGSSIILSQTKYASDLLVKAGMQECKPSLSPSSAKPAQFTSDPDFLDVQWFRTIVGSLQ